MKGMKLFATISVLCLGVAAIANTQSHAKNTIDGYKDDGNGHCTTVVSAACSDASSHDCVDVDLITPLYPRSTGACSNQLAKKP